MYADTTKQTQASEFLFLFHACKLTNNRPDQSVSVEDVSRVADIGQGASEAICSALRDARLIRYSSLLGDISVTRFGVSEVVTTKACPNTGANYFPGVRQMGLRFSRGHHLFDELQLRQITYNREAEQPDTDDIADSTDLTGIDTGRGNFTPDNKRGTQTHEDSGKSSEQVRKEVIEELEHLLQQLNNDPSSRVSKKATTKAAPAKPRFPAAKTPVTRPSANARSRIAPPPQSSAQSSKQRPSLLFNPEWQAGGVSDTATTDSGNHHNRTIDVSTGVEHLHKMMLHWCHQTTHSKSRSAEAFSFIKELEYLNESLFSFA